MFVRKNMKSARRSVKNGKQIGEAERIVEIAGHVLAAIAVAVRLIVDAIRTIPVVGSAQGHQSQDPDQDPDPDLVMREDEVIDLDQIREEEATRNLMLVEMPAEIAMTANQTSRRWTKKGEKKTNHSESRN